MDCTTTERLRQDACPLTPADVKEAIGLLERVNDAGHSLDWHTFKTDVLLAHEAKWGRDIFSLPQFVADVNTGARRFGEEIADELGIPLDAALVGAREYVTGTRATIVLQALRQFVALMDGTKKPFRKNLPNGKPAEPVRIVPATSKREPPPSMRLVKLNHAKGARR